MAGLTLFGAHVLTPDGLAARDLTIHAGRIEDAPSGRRIDLTGYWVLPGIIDLHGDGFERHLAPRRGALKDLGQGLMATDAELAACGITTATLAQFWSWEGGMRGPDFARRFLDALGRTGMLTDVRAQLRLETALLDEYAAFEEIVVAHNVPYVVFNDHLPHDALAKGKRPPRLTGQALKSGRSPEAHLAMLQRLHAAGPRVPDAVAALATRLAQRGILLGSHDDQTAQQRKDWHGIGVTLCEFPETHAAAEAAQSCGDAIVLGAPNLVRGGSHKGNVAVQDLVSCGLCDALASDYHYPSLVQAALRLVDDGVCGLPQAWALISEGPARVLRLTDRGRIAPGLRADILVLDPTTRRVSATLVNGHVSHMSGDVAARFMA